MARVNMATPASSSPVVMDDDEAMVEGAKLINSHRRATQNEPLGRVLVRSKRAGRNMRSEQRGRAVEVVIESASKRSKARCGLAAHATSAFSFFAFPRCRDCSFVVCAQFSAACRWRRRQSRGGQRQHKWHRQGGIQVRPRRTCNLCFLFLCLPSLLRLLVRRVRAVFCFVQMALAAKQGAAPAAQVASSRRHS